MAFWSGVESVDVSKSPARGQHQNKGTTSRCAWENPCTSKDVEEASTPSCARGERPKIRFLDFFDANIFEMCEQSTVQLGSCPCGF